jgi:hypothetical protein
LQLVPADANEKLKTRTLRDRMADEVFRYRAAGHDNFGFHISLAYQMRGLVAVERGEYQSILIRHLPAIIGRHRDSFETASGRQRQNIRQHNQRSHTLHLLQRRDFWIAFFGELLDLSVVFTDSGGYRFKCTSNGASATCNCGLKKYLGITDL